LLDQYGWSDALSQDFQPYADQGLSPGRVIVQQRGLYRIATDAGEHVAELSGRFAREAEAGGYAVAGDWVAATLRSDGGRALISAVLPRRTAFRRRAAGSAGGVQVVAANVDVAFLTVALNADFNLRRLERYLAAGRESGALPVVVLTKADLCETVAEHLAQVEAIALGASVHAISARAGEGLEALSGYLEPGRTVAVLGSSGVGKSTLINALAGAEIMATQAIREDDGRGRHTTTHRELLQLPNGALILDTPGMRELGLWDADAGLAATFEDVEALASQCRFRDCAHRAEPGCAIRAALEAGELDPERWASYGKLKRELDYLDRKEDPAARAAVRKVWIQRTKSYRARVRAKDEED
jgi:ribosome biogenesis GTPase / thiamine phosphate phosphatase